MVIVVGVLAVEEEEDILYPLVPLEDNVDDRQGWTKCLLFIWCKGLGTTGQYDNMYE